MNFHDIKNLTPSNGEKYILVENGEPTVVLLSFADYKKLSHSSSGSQRDLFQVREANVQQGGEEEGGIQQEVQELKEELKRELTLEDLPF